MQENNGPGVLGDCLDNSNRLHGGDEIRRGMFERRYVFRDRRTDLIVEVGHAGDDEKECETGVDGAIYDGPNFGRLRETAMRLAGNPSGGANAFRLLARTGLMKVGASSRCLLLSMPLEGMEWLDD